MIWVNQLIGHRLLHYQKTKNTHNIAFYKPLLRLGDYYVVVKRFLMSNLAEAYIIWDVYEQARYKK